MGARAPDPISTRTSSPNASTMPLTLAEIAATATGRSPRISRRRSTPRGSEPTAATTDVEVALGGRDRERGKARRRERPNKAAARWSELEDWLLPLAVAFEDCEDSVASSLEMGGRHYHPRIGPEKGSGDAGESMGRRCGDMIGPNIYAGERDRRKLVDTMRAPRANARTAHRASVWRRSWADRKEPALLRGRRRVIDCDNETDSVRGEIPDSSSGTRHEVSRRAHLHRSGQAYSASISRHAP